MNTPYPMTNAQTSGSLPQRVSCRVPIGGTTARDLRHPLAAEWHSAISDYGPDERPRSRLSYAGIAPSTSTRMPQTEAQTRQKLRTVCLLR